MAIFKCVKTHFLYDLKNVNADSNHETSKLRSLKTKIQTWNRRRRNSQGDSISQWWSWQQGTPQEDSPLGKPTIFRSGSLKEEIRQNPENSEVKDDGFVQADLVRRQQVTVKNAIISTTNPYCTGARAPKSKIKITQNWRENSPFSSSETTSAPSPSPPGSSSGSSSNGKESTGSSIISFKGTQCLKEGK